MNGHLFALFCIFFAIANCSVVPHKRRTNEVITAAICIIQGISGKNTTGVVRFQQSGTVGPININIKVQNLERSTKHGFHVHQFGDMSSSDGTAAGGHFNPTGVVHACPPVDRHVGDVGNIVSDNSGTAILQTSSAIMTFSGDSSILGRGLIVHQSPDDCVTQPTGNAGARIGQCVIGVCGSTCQSRFPINKVDSWDLVPLSKH